MQPCVHRSVFVFAILIGPTLSADGAPVEELTWNVPDDFPTGLSVPVVIPAPGLTGGSVDYRCDCPQVVGGVAQRDRSTGHVWIVARIDAASRGTELKLRLTHPGKHQATAKFEASPGGIDFVDGKRRVMHWQHAPKSIEGRYERANYIHPLFGLDGQTLTQDFPDDHKHHRGVFWAWHQLWVGDQRAGDGWEAKDFLSVVNNKDDWETGFVFARMKAVSHWMSPLVTGDSGTPTPIVEAKTTVRLFHAAENSQCIDFEIALQALLPNVKIGGSENAKGYSGFTVRVKPPREMVITDSESRLKVDRVSTVALWADVSGQFGENDEVSGISILSHPSLPEFPPKWLLRHYGMQNVAYPGQHPVALPADKPLLLRHRLVIHRGDVEAARVSEHQAVYSTSP